MYPAQKPLELIHARNFLTGLSTPAFLVDEAGDLLFYNEAAGALLGTPFEELGALRAEEWTKTFGPLGPDGQTLAIEDLPTTGALRQGRPAHTELTIRTKHELNQEIESSAIPIVTEEGQEGAMIFFWDRT